MPQGTNRAYLKRRALQELRATIDADCIEAEIPHNRMTRLYLERCAECTIDPTEECVACPIGNLCRTVS